MKLKISGAIAVSPSSYAEFDIKDGRATGVTLIQYDVDMRHHGYVYLTDRVEFEIDIPDDFEPRKEMAAGLEQKLQELRAKHRMEEKQVEEKIASLLCLEAPK